MSNGSHFPLPIDFAEITPEWLTSALAVRQIGAKAPAVLNCFVVVKRKAPAGTRLGGLTTGQAQLGTGGGPAVVALSAPRPNPTGGATRFVVSLPRAADVDLGVYDLAGRRIATLAHARLGAGDTDVSWEARGVRDGVYFARLTVDGRTYASRVTVLRTR